MTGILHIDSEKGWRGGQQQAAYLFEGLLKKGYKTAMVCRPGSEMDKYCKKNDLPHYSINMSGEIDLISAFRISRICRKEGFGILHLHAAHAVATGIWVKLFYGKLILIGVRRVSVPIKKNIFSKFKYNTRIINKHICISENIKKIMISDGVDPDRLITIHSGINLKKFDDCVISPDLKRKLNIPSNNIVIGTIAAITKEKDYPNLLNAAKKVIEKNDKVTFVAVGSGPDEKEVFALKDSLDLNDRFIFTGYRTDVGNFLKIFDIFVLASYREGLGTSLLDAQACRLPLIGCDTGGIPEVIDNGKNGFLVPPKDSDALKDAILELADDKNRRKIMGESGFKSVQSFSIENTILKNIELYNSFRQLS